VQIAGNERYFNREISWLAFNERVLDEAADPANRLLERVRFLAIVARNLDEFFEVRVAGLLQQAEAGVEERGADGLSPDEQLAHIAQWSQAQVERQYRIWNDSLLPALWRAGVRVRALADLTPAQREFVDRYWEAELSPVLTPVTIDPAHPFPRVGNKILCLAALLETEGERRLGVISVPRVLPRLVRLPADGDGYDVCFLADLVHERLRDLFRGQQVLDSAAFRVTRNSNLYVDEDEADNLIAALESELRNRRKGDVVRLEVEADTSPEIVEWLRTQFELAGSQVYRVNGPVNLHRVMSLLDAPRPDLKDEPHAPVEPAWAEAPETLLAEIRRNDVLLHHPYESFTPVVHFVQAAARDPRVLAIKQTLYRTGDESAIVRALIEAAEAGKEVTAVVELKARFDEESNIRWARRMEDAGVVVTYGLVGLKTHAKMSMLVRRDDDGLRRYVHLSSGNYNQTTARVYTDVSLMTADPSVAQDVSEVFNVLTSLSPKPALRRLLVAPFDLLPGTLMLIEREAEHALAGRPARVVAKMNALTERAVVDALYDASQAGVQIDLIVRGVCALRPGVPGLSDRIRVTSVVGRFLEHSRIFSFENGGQPEVWCGSDDWMERNLRRRVEVLFPIGDPRLRDRLRREVLSTYLADRAAARLLQPDGTYRRLRRDGEANFSAQDALVRAARGEPVEIPDAAPPEERLAQASSRQADVAIAPATTAAPRVAAAPRL
jgi:polyphosphate kinase